MHSDFIKFKEAEDSLDFKLSAQGLSVIRLDGVRFSKLTRQFEKPFSNDFEEAMDAAAIAVKKEVLPMALITYVASDEISFILSDKVTELSYGRRIQKMTSVAASFASLAFMKTIPSMVGSPAFDGRALELAHSSEIIDYVSWRRLDTRKNAIGMAARHLKTHSELTNVSTAMRGEMLVGTEFEKIPDRTFNGRFIVKENGVLIAVPAMRELAQELSTQAAAVHDTMELRAG